MKPATQLALDNAEEAVRIAQVNRLTDVESAAMQMHIAQLAVWREQLEARTHITYIPTHPSVAEHKCEPGQCGPWCFHWETGSNKMVAEGCSDDSIRQTLRREVEARYGKATPSIEAYPTHPKPRGLP